MKPLVSTIIPTRNRSNYVTEAVESVLAQTYPHIEIFLIDDGSTDGTGEAMKRFGDKIIYLYQENKGVCAARNLALSKAQGKYIAFLDDDDIWLPEKIERDVEFLEKNDDYGFVFSGFCYFSDDQDRMDERVSLKEGEETTYDYLYGDNVIYSTSLVTMRKACLDEVGFFDESLIQSADYDMWLRIAKHYKFGFIPECLAKYRLHNTNMSKNLKRRIKVYKQIFNKPEICEGRSWMERRTRVAKLYHYAAYFFRRHHRYLDASGNYAMAIFYCPFIGYYYWSSEVEGMRFTFIYRILRTYWLVIYCFFKSLVFPKKDIPSTTLIDV